MTISALTSQELSAEKLTVVIWGFYEMIEHILILNVLDSDETELPTHNLPQEAVTERIQDNTEPLEIWSALIFVPSTFLCEEDRRTTFHVSFILQFARGKRRGYFSALLQLHRKLVWTHQSWCKQNRLYSCWSYWRYSLLRHPEPL